MRICGSTHSGSEKRPDSVYIIITNAGLLGAGNELMWKPGGSRKTGSCSAGPISKYMDQADGRVGGELAQGVADWVIRNKWPDPAEGLAI
jgi:hypothetical protein